MFGLKKELVELNSICNGRVIPITQVPDKMFANKLLGDGVSFEFEEEQIYSPCDGKIIMIAETKHAIGIRLINNAEVLIHVGMDTVNLHGEGLSLMVTQGDKVKKGQCLLKVAHDDLKKQGVNLVTPVILTTSEGFELDILKDDGKVTIEDPVFTVQKV